MKILIVARGYPTKQYNINGIFEFDQAKALAKAGHDVFYLSIDLRSIRRKRKFGMKFLKKNGINICSVNIPCGRLPRKILYWVGTIAYKKAYTKIKKRYGEPHIIHAHFTDYGYMVAKAMEQEKNIKIPFVITEHSSGISEKKIEPSLYKTAKYAYENCDQVISVSRPLAQKIQKLFYIKAITVHNIVDTNLFEYTYRKPDKTNFRFISVGNLIKRKKMDLLINAFNDFNKIYPYAQLIICGDGEERENLESLIEALQLKERVFLLGNCTRQRISKEMQMSDVFVLATENETFGVSYIEAMASGLPVIATICGGPEEFVNDSNGILIPTNDRDALILAMITMYKNITKYNAFKISKETKRIFSPEKIANDLKEVYAKVQ